MIEKLKKLIEDAKNVSDNQDNSIEFESMGHDIKFRRSFDSGFRPYMEVSLNRIPFDRIMINEKSRRDVMSLWETLKLIRFRAQSAKVDSLRSKACKFMDSL